LAGSNALWVPAFNFSGSSLPFAHDRCLAFHEDLSIWSHPGVVSVDSSPPWGPWWESVRSAGFGGPPPWGNSLCPPSLVLANVDRLLAKTEDFDPSGDSGTFGKAIDRPSSLRCAAIARLRAVESR